MAIPILREISRVSDVLYVSGEPALTPDNIRRHGITNVINLTRDVPSMSPKLVKTVRISIDDHPSANLGTHFNFCADSIHQVSKQGGKTLVHCVAGVSRSVSVCLAYLMKYRQMSLAAAFNKIRRQRFIVNPNPGFWKQLIAFEHMMYGRSSVEMVFTDRGWQPDIYLCAARDSPTRRSPKLAHKQSSQYTSTYADSYRMNPSKSGYNRGQTGTQGYAVKTNSWTSTGHDGSSRAPGNGSGRYSSTGGHGKHSGQIPLPRFVNAPNQEVSLPQRFVTKHTVYLSPNMR